MMRQITINFSILIFRYIYINGQYKKCLTSLVVKNANVEATITCQLGKNNKYGIKQENRYLFETTFLDGPFGKSL